MCQQFRVCGVAAIGVALALVVPLAAQQPAQPAPKLGGTPTDMPTKKDPLRFTAFNVSMPTGMAGVTQIVIERWSTDAERKGLLEFVETANTAKAVSGSCSTRCRKSSRASASYARQIASAGISGMRPSSRCRMARGRLLSRPTSL